MISNNSLSAFSAATTTTTTAQAQRPQPPRLVPVQATPSAQQTAPAKTVLPTQRPSVSPPRGTLLNLSV